MIKKGRRGIGGHSSEAFRGGLGFSPLFRIFQAL